MAKTQIPCASVSAARPSANRISAVLATEVPVKNALGPMPVRLATLMIRPRPRLSMRGRTACEQTNAPRTLISTQRHHSSASTSQSGPTGPGVPALLTSRVTGPRSRSVRSTTARTSVLWVTSAAKGIARPPARWIVEAAVLISASVRATSATAAPASASVLAMARPIPRPAPETMATCPSRTPVMVVPFSPSEGLAPAVSRRGILPSGAESRCTRNEITRVSPHDLPPVVPPHPDIGKGHVAVPVLAVKGGPEHGARRHQCDVPSYEDAYVEEFGRREIRSHAVEHVLHPLRFVDEASSVRDHTELCRENPVESLHVPPCGSVHPRSRGMLNL